MATTPFNGPAELNFSCKVHDDSIRKVVLTLDGAPFPGLTSGNVRLQADRDGTTLGPYTGTVGGANNNEVTFTIPAADADTAGQARYAIRHEDTEQQTLVEGIITFTDTPFTS